MRTCRVQISCLPQMAKRRDDHATVFLTFCHLISIFANFGDHCHIHHLNQIRHFPFHLRKRLAKFRQISTLAKFSIFAIFVEITIFQEAPFAI